MSKQNKPDQPDNSEFAKDAPLTDEQRDAKEQADAEANAKVQTQSILTDVGDVLNTFSSSHGIGERQAFDKIFKTYGVKFPTAVETKTRTNPDQIARDAAPQIPATPPARSGSRRTKFVRSTIRKAKATAKR